MFTITQIKDAHSKVRSGADFPAYIQDLKKLGIANYTAFVSDGHTDYYGKDDFKVSSPAIYSLLTILDEANSTAFKTDLITHQNGKTDYPTFCKDCANAGIEKWIVCTEKMNCTYYDTLGNEILKEEIPE
ncbi:DUF1398 domain-containing protein [Pedobacter alpinus]|uniref:DUF1398 domain-containing protein n=1 Tax=Pedobacter alpinus TaxID=1590643 RepID=A0ABW5TRI3_9SPHI